MTAISDVIGNWVHAVANGLGTQDFIVLGTIAIILVSLICGSVGAMVVGNRMAFFSDALAHCAFAGVGLGIVTALIIGGRRSEDLLEWLLPLIMVVFGVAVGVAIAYVREKTNLASDTVIGVFFAGAIGFGAILFGALKLLTNKSAESFLFGSINFVKELDIFFLVLLGLATFVVLWLWYNHLVFASFNPSLARSRQIPVRFYNYLFIVLLAVIVNVCIQAVGILLINAMLIVPAATAINLSRNLRQMYWWTIVLSLLAGLGGILISLNFSLHVGRVPVPLGTSGCIVMLSVFGFAVSMLVGPRLRRQTA
jgi:zinc transport system permease protein